MEGCEEVGVQEAVESGVDWMDKWAYLRYKGRMVAQRAEGI